MGQKRLLSLDVFRGATIIAMVLVNNAGSWGSVYAPLRHASWNGLTPTDLVFPFFMFIMGISTWISLGRSDFRPRWGVVARRTAVIFALGLALAWLGSVVNDGFEGSLARLRIPGVLQRLAVAWLLTIIVAVFIRHRYIPWLVAVILTCWFAVLRVCGEAAVGAVDAALLGPSHILSPDFDPEGVLSTVPAVCNVLIGFLCGRIITERDFMRLFAVGAAMAFAGWLLSYACPINKKLWSPTFVLVTCGMGATMLALTTWAIDVCGHRRWSVPFEAVGVNPLFIYVFAGALAIALDGVRNYCYKTALEPFFGSYGGSLAWALLFALAVWAVGYALFCARIYIKI